MASFLDYNIAGIPLVPIVIIAIIGFIFIKLWKNQSKEIKAPDINIKKQTTKEVDKLIKNHGWKKGKFNRLRVCINPIGIIMSYAIEYHNIDSKKTKEPDSDKKSEIILTPDNIYYLLRVRKFGFFSGLLSLLNIGVERYIIEANMIDNLNQDNFLIDTDLVLNTATTFRNYNNIYYCNEKGRYIIHDIAVMLAFEQQTKKFVEFTPLMTLLEIEQAKVKFKSELFTKLEKERFRGDIEKYTKT